MAARKTGGVVVLLEQIQEQNRATIDAIFALERRINRRLEEFRASVEPRLSALEPQCG